MVQTTAHRLQVGSDNWDTPKIGRFDGGVEPLELIQLGVV
jgi:hypothetical protein